MEWLPSTKRFRLSIGTKNRINIRPHRTWLAEIGLLTTSGRLEALFHTDDFLLEVKAATPSTPLARRIRPYDPRGTKLRALREEISYYFSGSHLGVPSGVVLRKVEMTPVPWAIHKGSVWVNLRDWLEDNQGELDLTQGIDVAGPVLLDQASLEQIADRLRDIALEQIEDN